MSYILEAIKRSESARGNKRLSTAAINNDADEVVQKNNLPWVAIAIFVNAIILLIWISYQIFNKQAMDNSVAQEHVDLNVATSEVVSNEVKPQTDKLVVAKSAAGKEIETHQDQHEGEAIDANTHDDNSLSVVSDVGLNNSNKQEAAQASLDESVAQQASEFFSVKKSHQMQSEAREIKSQQIEYKQQDRQSHEQTTMAKVEPIPEFVVKEELDDREEIKPLDIKDIDEEVAAEPPAILQVKNQNVPNYEELPYSLQKKIPDLSISVHIYNADQVARKVRINGQLLYEGDQIDRETTIEEITPRGVIIDFSGTLFRKNLH